MIASALRRDPFDCAIHVSIAKDGRATGLLRRTAARTYLKLGNYEWFLDIRISTCSS
jgi:hypothetical protein